MAPQTQKALVVTEVGQPLRLVSDRPVPTPGRCQLQIRVRVAGVNPHDQKCRDNGLIIKNNLPAVLTNDVVGEVIALGEGTTRFSIGDCLFSMGGMTPQYSQNGFQQYAILDEEACAKVPTAFTEDEVATLPVNVVAAFVALFHSSTLAIPAPWTPEAATFDFERTTLLVVGGGSNCGRFGVQLAALVGIGRIVVVGGDEVELTSYGATHVVGRHGSSDEVVERVRGIVGDDLLYAFDAINPPATQFIGLNCLSSSKKGKMARLCFTGVLPEVRIWPKKAGYELLNANGQALSGSPLGKAFWETLPIWLVEKKVRPTMYSVVEGLDPARANEVIDAYREGTKVDKTNFHVY